MSVEPFSATRRLSWVEKWPRRGALTAEDRPHNGSFDLCADFGYDRQEADRMMSEALGRTITAEEDDPLAWVARLPIPDDYTKDARGRMYAPSNGHGLAANPLVLTLILWRAPRTMSQFLQELISGAPPTVAHP